MAKYKQGLIEQCIKEIISDYFEEILSKTRDTENEPEDESEEGIKKRGRVRDPDHDKRLKDNRGKDE